MLKIEYRKKKYKKYF